MIDIHFHILPGVDDGAKDMRESVAMARVAHADGVRHIFATPHFSESYRVKKPQVEQGVKKLKAALDEAGIPITVYPSNEVRLIRPELVMEDAKKQAFCYLGTSENFILLEQSWKGYHPDSAELVRWFLDRRIRPVIPHPERHYFFRENPRLLFQLIDLGAWTQISADSLVGYNPKEAVRFCRMLLNRNSIHTLATDAHNIRRKPNLGAGFDVIEQWSGKDKVLEIQERMKKFIK